MGDGSSSVCSSSGVWKERKKAVPDFGSLSTRIWPWYRLTSSRIRELVNLYHGQIRVESEPKSGTAFFLSFQTPEEEQTEEEPSPNA